MKHSSCPIALSQGLKKAADALKKESKITDSTPRHDEPLATVLTKY
jgi:hypothetical protein